MHTHEELLSFPLSLVHEIKMSGPGRWKDKVEDFNEFCESRGERKRKLGRDPQLLARKRIKEAETLDIEIFLARNLSLVP